MKKIFIVILFTFVLACSSEAASEASTGASTNSNDEIPASEASSFVGSYKSVCGKIVDTRFSSNSNGSPTFLNFDKPYPNHPFVAVVWGRDRSNFSGKPEVLYKGKDVCVDGLIETYKGKPQIIVDDPSQIN